MYIYIYKYVTSLSLYTYIYISLSIYVYIYIYVHAGLKQTMCLLVEAPFGWHSLSNASCLTRPHVFSTTLLV